jgi:hypothetical protein
LLCPQPANYDHQQKNDDSEFFWHVHLRYLHLEEALKPFGYSWDYLDWRITYMIHDPNTISIHRNDFLSFIDRRTWDMFSFNSRWLKTNGLLTVSVWKYIPCEISMLRTGSTHSATFIPQYG